MGCADSEGEGDCGTRNQSPLPNNRSLSRSGNTGPRPIPPDQLKCNILKGNFPQGKYFLSHIKIIYVSYCYHVD